LGKRLIAKHLREIQKNDCIAFNPEEIGKDKFFLRKYFVKNDRETNMRRLNEFITDKPKLFNRTIDCDDEISKLN
jgi:hypothetical protein